MEDGDGAQVSIDDSKTEVVKDLMSHIKYFEFYPDSSESLWRFLNRGTMKIDFCFRTLTTD